MDNLRFYRVNMKYIRNLSAVDDNVMSVSPQTNKEERPFLGIIVILGDKSYCIPLTSPKNKHINMRNREDFSRIIDNNGKIIGCLNFNNMIPVSKDVITPLDIVINEKDSYAEKGKKKILRQHRTELVRQIRSQIFRQVVQKFRRHTDVCQGISVQNAGKYASR